ncbi:LPS export ABC transporter periplasmic protein LptC [Phaeobacter porticola]|uniref:Lipopolysaccharide-assembly, LptC-related protein n=1 Tax=Phaeobacter porticola TaxID=1844006 RepID=A0A1L3I912_9RHOB|nr:LPS export ABC transporter periplasmic protein LptC [Phaeobacter porticola]APG48699.1 Lipopolysaccharide-assembly, LptC-related protein [Phaeobacter porticola]
MDGYSRLVAYLKVLLPLTALALMSTMFLISRGVDTEAVVPFAQQDLQDRTRGQQITAPFYSGTTAKGDEIMVTAKSARPGSASSPATALNLEAEIRMVEGGSFFMSSDTGALRPDKDIANFRGDVEILTSDGLKVTTDALNAALNGVRADSPGPVQASGAFGALTAGAMQIDTKTEDGPVHMVFNKGVKLLYDPQQSER